MIAINYGNPDKSKLAGNIILMLRFRVKFLTDFLIERYDKKGAEVGEDGE